MTKPDIAISLFLERYGTALCAGDLPAICACWAVPALVLSDQGAIAVNSIEEVERFFASAVAWYRAQGLMTTRPEGVRVEALGERLAAVDVRWAALDAMGQVRSSEHSRYILALGEDGAWRIRVALALTA